MDSKVKESLGFIFGRRSIRVYKPGEIGEDLVQAMLEAAMSAPSAVAKDPWRFVVIRDTLKLHRVASVLPNGQMLANASLGIVVCGDLDAAHDHQVSYLLQDCSAAVQNLLLAAHLLGLGGCWLGIHPRAERIKQVSALLDLPAHVIPVAGIALGWPGEEKEPRTRYHAEYVHAEKW